MKIKQQQLSNQLKQGLAPIYLVSGDESLLVQESADEIRECCRNQGFTEREVHHIDNSFNWEDLLLSSNSMSLFADRKLIECQFKSTKLGDAGSKAVQRLLEEPNPDVVFLFIMPKLDASTQRGKWYKAVEKTGISLPLWPIERYQLPRWIQTRMQQYGLQANDDAVNFLADNVEGNLLAAKQEIEKLRLLANDQIIDLEKMTELTSNSSRYTVFNLTDRCLSADSKAALKTLYGLRNEGIDATVILWALAREVRTLHRLQTAQQQGQPLGQIMKAERIFESRQRLVQAAMQRLNLNILNQLLRKSRQIDQSIKGLSDDSQWLLLEQLVLRFSSR